MLGDYRCGFCFLGQELLAREVSLLEDISDYQYQRPSPEAESDDHYENFHRAPLLAGSPTHAESAL